MRRAVLTVDVECAKCGGTGVRRPSGESGTYAYLGPRPCSCLRAVSLTALLPGIVEECPHCLGSGHAYRSDDDCGGCDGTGVVPASREAPDPDWERER